jgi:hypothetical protein
MFVGKQREPLLENCILIMEKHYDDLGLHCMVISNMKSEGLTVLLMKITVFLEDILVTGNLIELSTFWKQQKRIWMHSNRRRMYQLFI